MSQGGAHAQGSTGLLPLRSDDGRVVGGRVVGGRVVGGRVVDGRVVNGRVVHGRVVHGRVHRRDDGVDNGVPRAGLRPDGVVCRSGEGGVGRWVVR